MVDQLKLGGLSIWEGVAVIIQNPKQIKFLLLPAAISLALGWGLWRCVYNLYFHPLAKFPGPKLAAVSELWVVKSLLGGRGPFDQQKLHEIYGPIVRIAPNELSVSDAVAWKDIYGHHPRDKTFIKSEFYTTKDPDLNIPNIISERDPVAHGEMRRMLAHAFSTRALMEQEEIIHSYVDLMITRLGQRYVGKDRGPEGEYCDLVAWYNYTTFDIIGDLAFGDATTFACLKEQRPHTWVSIILGTVSMAAWGDVMRRFPVLEKIGMWLTPAHLLDQKRMIINFSKDAVARRLGTNVDRKDFWSYILNREESKDLSLEEFGMNAQLLVIAGSETTATQLSALTYFLEKNPRALNKLKDEVRNTFKNYSEINAQNTAKLQYLNAAIEEGLRLYPSVPIGLPRTSPGAMVAGKYIPQGTDISVHSFAVTRDPAFWERPDEFCPERWIDPQNTDKKEASQPFSLGPRGCLGRNLAYLELRVILAKIIYAYDFELIDKNLDWLRDSKAFLLWNKPQLNVKVKKRPGVQWRAQGGEDGGELPL